MTLSCFLTHLANAASIMTALAAVYFFAERSSSRQDRAKRLLTYLKEVVPQKDPKHPSRSIVHLMARLGMSQEQVLQAALDNDKDIFRSIRPGLGEDVVARDIMFVYSPDKAKTQEGLA